MTIARKRCYYVNIFSFYLCFSALVIASLFKLEKKCRFKCNHTVLKVLLEGLNFFHLNIGKAFEIQRKPIEYAAENKEKRLKIKSKQRLYKL